MCMFTQYIIIHSIGRKVDKCINKQFGEYILLKNAQ